MLELLCSTGVQLHPWMEPWWATKCCDIPKVGPLMFRRDTAFIIEVEASQKLLMPHKVGALMFRGGKSGSLLV